MGAQLNNIQHTPLYIYKRGGGGEQRLGMQSSCGPPGLGTLGPIRPAVGVSHGRVPAAQAGSSG